MMNKVSGLNPSLISFRQSSNSNTPFYKQQPEKTQDYFVKNVKSTVPAGLILSVMMSLFDCKNSFKAFIPSLIENVVIFTSMSLGISLVDSIFKSKDAKKSNKINQKVF